MRPPRVLARSFPLIPAISTAYDSVQLLGFVLSGRLTLIHSLYDSCSSGQSFAAGFLQIPRRQGHPCLWLYPSHCRADSGLSPVRTCARRAHQQKRRMRSASVSYHIIVNHTVFPAGTLYSKRWASTYRYRASSTKKISSTTTITTYRICAGQYPKLFCTSIRTVSSGGILH